MEQEPITVFPVTLEKTGMGNFTDFRPTILPSDAPDEVEEVADPKDSSAVEPASSSESPKVEEQLPAATPAQEPAVKVSTPPKAPSLGKRASS